MPLPNTDSFYITPCTASEKIIILNMKNSNDIDGYFTKFIKDIVDYESVPLMFNFNKFFLTEVTPNSSKYDNSIPVYKAYKNC